MNEDFLAAKGTTARFPGSASGATQSNQTMI
jgi:hypothetical protein